MVIEELKAKGGFGGAKLEIHIPKDKYQINEVVRGEIHLLGGRVKQRIRALHVCLLHEWSTESYGMDLDITVSPGGGGGGIPVPFVDSVESRYELKGDKGKDKVLDVELARDIEIHPKQRKNFPFEIELSKVQREELVREVWKIQTQAKIPFAKDAFSEREIKIVTPSKKDK